MGATTEHADRALLLGPWMPCLKAIPSAHPCLCPSPSRCSSRSREDVHGGRARTEAVQSAQKGIHSTFSCRLPDGTWGLTSAPT